MMFSHYPRRRTRRAVSAAALTVALLGVVGCGDGRPPRAAVGGTVLLDGEPLTQGNITFVPDGGRPSSAKIGPDGKFKLLCFEEDDGALIGTHRVSITAKTIVSENNIIWHAPKRYANYLSSGLTIEVTESVDDLVIELTSAKKRGKK